MSFRKIALSFPLGLAAITASATAGSLTEPSSPPVVMTPKANGYWSGHYTGVFVGYGDGSYKQGVSKANELGVKVDVDGVLVGLRYGHNWKKSNQVFGFDISFSSGVDGNAPQGTSGPDWSCVTGDCNVSIDSLLTGRGRYGALINPKTLVYGAAGISELPPEIRTLT